MQGDFDGARVMLIRLKCIGIGGTVATRSYGFSFTFRFGDIFISFEYGLVILRGFRIFDWIVG